MVSLSIAVLGGRQFVSLGEKDKYFEFCMLEEEQLESMWRRKLEVVWIILIFYSQIKQW